MEARKGTEKSENQQLKQLLQKDDSPQGDLSQIQNDHGPLENSKQFCLLN